MAELEVAARVVSATVFADRARVVRRGRAALPAGGVTLVVRGLPASLDETSVRAELRGAGLRLVAVDVATRDRTDAAAPEAAALQRRLDELDAQERELDDEERAAEVALAFAEQLSRSAARAFGGAIADGRAALADVEAVAAEATGRWEAAATRRRAVAGRRLELRRERDAVSARLLRASGRLPLDREVRVVAEAAEAVEAELEVAVLVAGASWEPVYDVALDGERLTWTSAALVRQRTGEDWSGVALQVSTARPATTAGLPELDPWYVRRRPPPPVRGWAGGGPPPPAMAAPMPPGSPPPPLDTTGEIPVLAAFEALAPAEVQLASAERTGGATTFVVPAKADVPGDGSPRRVTIAARELPARLDHVTAPQRAEEVHLRARAENTTGATLLAGPVSVLVEGASVGATRIDDTPAGGELELSLGLDERVRVQRELVTRNASRSLGDRVRRLSLAWETTVTSALDRSTTVELLDRLPVPADADIKVKVDRLAPEPDERDDLGRLTWRLPLPAGGTATVVLATTVEHPKALDVVGLD